MKDEFYNRYIVKGQLFDPVIATFKENGQRYNLLNSAIVELFEFIRAVSVVISSFKITVSAMDSMFKLSSVENWWRCDPKHNNNLLNTGCLAFSNTCKILNIVTPCVLQINKRGHSYSERATLFESTITPLLHSVVTINYISIFYLL